MVDEQLSWFSGLKFGERQAMQEREALLDRLSATAEERGPMRVALLLDEAEGALTEAATLAYELGAAGQFVWLYTRGSLPAGIPADFHERVRHINPETGRPLVEQLPPADLFLTPDPVLLAPFYRAERPLLYWHRPGTVLPSGWATLPARILTAGPAGMTLDGRRAFPVAPGTAGWVSALAAGLAVVGKDPLRKRRPRLSLCMIVKNEEKYLQSCLLSVYGVVDEICIVDTGSTDRTVQIAERLGARVEHRVWRDDFAWARNESLAMATGDWILHLDADEVLTREAQERIPQLIQRNTHEGYLLPIDSVLPNGTTRNHGLRLFRCRADVYYKGIIHENVGTRLAELGARVSLVEGAILHFGYSEDPMLATGKRSRNRQLLLKARMAEPENPWFAYYLAVEEYLLGEPEEALRLLEEVPYEGNWIDGDPATLRINAHRLMGQERMALQIAHSAAEAFPHATNLRAVQAQIAYAFGEEELLREALDWLTDPKVQRVGASTFAANHASLLQGYCATDPAQKEQYLLQVRPLQLVARALMRHWLRTYGLAETLRRSRQTELDDPFGPLLLALSDLQDWPTLQSVIEMRPELRQNPAAGSLYLAQGRPEEALACWQRSGVEGWQRYAVLVAFMGGAQMLAVAEPHLSPLEWRALQEMVQGDVTWRWAVLVPHFCNINNPNLLEQLLARAPFLADTVLSYMRISVLA